MNVARCRHGTDLTRPECRAGVPLDSVREGISIPCVRTGSCADRTLYCAKASFPDHDEVEDYWDALRVRAAKKARELGKSK